MCRLYGFCATEPTKVECTLVHAQNALMAQSRSDLKGVSHAHGWGVVTYDNAAPHAERQAWAAYRGEHFQRAASRVYADLVIAHVRRATVGAPDMHNTHPFVHGRWSFAHNGTAPHFGRLKERFLNHIAPPLRGEIKGETDSEHLFYYLLSLMDAAPQKALTAIVKEGVETVASWVAAIDVEAKPGLNVMMTDGEKMVGVRWGRSLYHVERDGVYDCEICGFPHIRHDPDHDYRAVVVASEPLTHEVWIEIPDRSLWSVEGRSGAISITPI